MHSDQEVFGKASEAHGPYEEELVLEEQQLSQPLEEDCTPVNCDMEEVEFMNRLTLREE